MFCFRLFYNDSFVWNLTTLPLACALEKSLPLRFRQKVWARIVLLDSGLWNCPFCCFHEWFKKKNRPSGLWGLCTFPALSGLPWSLPAWPLSCSIALLLGWGVVLFGAFLLLGLNIRRAQVARASPSLSGPHRRVRVAGSPPGLCSCWQVRRTSPEGFGPSAPRFSELLCSLAPAQLWGRECAFAAAGFPLACSYFGVQACS